MDLESEPRSYKKTEFLGEGQFATVYKAISPEGQIVAIKKIKLGNYKEAADGIHRTALREIKYLYNCSHKNIIKILDVFGHKSNINIVYEYMDTNLETLIYESSIAMGHGEIKCLFMMILFGLEYIHNQFILHRDLKPNNLLLDINGILKIADFGLAREFGSPNQILSKQVVTRWYRCPELIYGATNYSTGVDIWSVACILAEILQKAPLFAGESDLDQLAKIVSVLGNPSDTEWPEMKSLPDYIAFKPAPKIPLADIFTAASNEMIDLLQKMLQYNPLSRPDSSQCLDHIYFSLQPVPIKLNLSKVMQSDETKSNKRKTPQSPNNGYNCAKKLAF